MGVRGESVDHGEVMRAALMFFCGNTGNNGNMVRNLLNRRTLLFQGLFPLVFLALGTVGTIQRFVPSVPTRFLATGNRLQSCNQVCSQPVRSFVPSVPDVPVQIG